MSENSIDMAKMDELKERANECKLGYTTRDQYIKKYNEMYMMELNITIPKGASMIISPDARNQVLGAARMMYATEPIINLRAPKEDQNMSDLENFTRIALEMSNRITRIPLHHELILSAMLYAEMHTGITLTADLVKQAKATGQSVKKFERFAEMTPWIFNAYNPGTGYPEMGNYGMSGYLREVKTTVRKVLETFGDALPSQIANKKKSASVTMKTWFDDDYKAVWIEDQAIILDEPDWPCFPVSVQITDGSALFENQEDQRAPLLYTLMKSKLWEEETAALTAMYHFTKSMAAVPLLVHKQGSTKQKLEIDYDQKPYGVVELGQDEEFDIVHNKGTIDPNLMESYQTARRLVEESTIYKAALGAPPEQASTFSELSLLATSGRAPLVNTQKRGGWGIANILETAMLLSRDLGGTIKTYGQEMSASDLPVIPLIDVKLDIMMPEDQLSKASIVATLVKAGVASRQWLQENVLQIPDTEGMTEQIWFEGFLDMMFQKFGDEQMNPPQMDVNNPPMLPDMNQNPGAAGGEGGPVENMNAGPGLVNPGVEGVPAAMGGMVRGAGQGQAPGDQGVIAGGM